MENLIQIIGWAVIAAVVLFVISSVILFIRDGILAKREARNRRIKYKVMFIISMAITAMAAMTGIFLFLLAMAVMRSM